MDTYRLKFIDTDESFSLPVADTSVQGFMPVRAPKGETEAVYFKKGSADTIHAMLGVPSVNYPDLQDAIDFNNQFGLWISAPAGTSEAYPTLYGGTYLTSRGLFPFYDVADKLEPNYKTLVDVGDEERFTNLEDTNAIASFDIENDNIVISNINAQVLSQSTGFIIKYWGNSENGIYADARDILCTVVGTKIVTVDPSTDEEVEIGEVVDGVLTISGIDGVAADVSFTLEQNTILDSTEYRETDLESDFKVDGEFTEATYKEALNAQIEDKLQWIINIEDDCHFIIAQKSPTEKKTEVTIKEIGYDEYYYDLSVNMYRNEYMLENRATAYPSINDTGNPLGLFVVMNDDEEANGANGIYQAQVLNSEMPVNVTDLYRTKYVRVKGGGITRDSNGDELEGSASEETDIQNAGFVDSLWFVSTTDVLMRCELGGAVPIKLNPKFNTITFSIAEEVYPGQMMSGGEFFGSLSETGVDSYGAEIYFPKVLPDTSLSFVEIDAEKTFATTNGFFKGKRITDNFGEAPSVLATNLQGQRYVAEVVKDLVAKGIPGGANDQSFVPVLSTAWTESLKSAYNEVEIFMEPTGIEDFKETIFAARGSSHKMSTFISAKKITLAEAVDPSTIVVTGRSTGTAQYCNEFLRKDKITGKKYWTSLIGAVGTKLAKIMEVKLGGWAPMYTDNSSTLGGQLPISVVKAKYDFDEDQQQALDEKGVNPIVLDSYYGVMIISQKTTQDPTSLTDWSYLGHSMSFDLFKRDMQKAVMIPQIGKPNNTYYQGVRHEQADALLDFRITGSQPIWAQGLIQVESVNTDKVKATRSFKIKAKVKVEVFSEFVEFEFVNIAQTATV